MGDLFIDIKEMTFCRVQTLESRREEGKQGPRRREGRGGKKKAELDRGKRKRKERERKKKRERKGERKEKNQQETQAFFYLKDTNPMGRGHPSGLI